MIFEEQIARKPDHYPFCNDFINAMWEGHWTPNEFSFKSDIQDFQTELTKQEQEIIKRTLSAIGQIEIAVKKFWAKLGDNLPHPSLTDMGLVMAQIEVIHNKAYEKLLDKLGFEELFEENLKIKIIKGRVKYLQKYNKKVYGDDERKQFIYSIILFTLFVENVSLFSQFYIILWFNRYRNVLKDTAQQVQYTKNEEDCLIEGTEVLTPSGWLDFRNINVGDDIYQFTEDGFIELTKVLHKIEKHFEGNLIKFSRIRNQCAVTPTHDMIYYNTNDQFKKVKAENLKLHKQTHIPIGGVLKNEGIDELSLEDRLRIAIQADGTNAFWTNQDGEKKLRGVDGGYTHYMGLTKQRKKERVEWILNNLNIRYSTHPTEKPRELRYNFQYNQDTDYKIFKNWIDLSNKSPKWCKEFIDEVVEWDGYKVGKNSVGYCSILKENIDMVQTIAILAGYSTNIIYGNESSRDEKYNDCYRLSIMKTNLKPKSHGVKKQEVSYDGNVYCVTVPSGNIITRYEDKTFIVGNCHAKAGIQIINTIRHEHPELFDDELEEKIRQECFEAYNAEEKIIDWMIGNYSKENIDKDILKEYIKNRINESMQQIGFQSVLEVDEEVLKQTIWMEEDVHGNAMTDFFQKRPVEYSKNNKSYDLEDLF